MKKFFLLIFIVAQAAAGIGQNSKPPCILDIQINPAFSRAAALDSILVRYTKMGLPGAAVAIFSEAEGWWAGARGYANLEKMTPLENCHLEYLQSVSKTFMAVEILQLHEQGKIEMDAPMTNYLPAKFSRYIMGAEKITIRMLLNQTSGVPEYNSDPAFVSQVLMHPSDYFSSENCLASINGKEPQFPAGSKYSYTNTNYLLLSLVANAITGDHAAYIREHIFKPLELTNAYYGLDHNYLDGLNLPESYWDALNVGRPANFTRLQKVTVACSKGDDGIVCTPADAVKFLKGLMEGKLLNEASMKMMLEFVKDEKGVKHYGMGIAYFDLGGIPAYGHGGGGVGAGCALVYIPSFKLYLFIATNVGVLVDGELPKKASDMKDEVLIALLK